MIGYSAGLAGTGCWEILGKTDRNVRLRRLCKLIFRIKCLRINWFFHVAYVKIYDIVIWRQIYCFLSSTLICQVSSCVTVNQINQHIGSYLFISSLNVIMPIAHPITSRIYYLCRRFLCYYYCSIPTVVTVVVLSLFLFRPIFFYLKCFI